MAGVIRVYVSGPHSLAQGQTNRTFRQEEEKFFSDCYILRVYETQRQNPPWKGKKQGGATIVITGCLRWRKKTEGEGSSFNSPN